MALRHHVQEGNLKWVSLLLWAGADPRLPVCRLDTDTEDVVGTALQDAVQYGNIEIVKKFKPSSAHDDLRQLICQCWLTPQPQIVELLIASGADVTPKADGDDRDPVQTALTAFQWSLDPTFSSGAYYNSKTEAALRTIEILATHGARWQPADRYRVSCLRRTLAAIAPSDAARYLRRIVSSKAIGGVMFKELMKTPKMQALLDQSLPGMSEMRHLAGCGDSSRRRRRLAE